MLIQGSEPIRALACFRCMGQRLLGDENNLLSMNLLHLFGSELDDKFPGSSFHWDAFYLELEGHVRLQRPRKFKDTETCNQSRMPRG